MGSVAETMRAFAPLAIDDWIAGSCDAEVAAEPLVSVPCSPEGLECRQGADRLDAVGNGEVVVAQVLRDHEHLQAGLEAAAGEPELLDDLARRTRRRAAPRRRSCCRKIRMPRELTAGDCRQRCRAETGSELMSGAGESGPSRPEMSYDDSCADFAGSGTVGSVAGVRPRHEGSSAARPAPLFTRSLRADGLTRSSGPLQRRTSNQSLPRSKANRLDQIRSGPSLSRRSCWPIVADVRPIVIVTLCGYERLGIEADGCGSARLLHPPRPPRPA